jgi:hypothetical protein
MYRSVRSTCPLTRNRFVYFQMSLSRCTSTPLMSLHPVEEVSPSVCIGLSTRQMPLNTLVGTWKHSVGFYSSGHIIAGAQWQSYVALQTSYAYDDVVGVLIHIDEDSLHSSRDGGEMLVAR